MIISKKKFEEEVEKRVCEKLKCFEENQWRDERERERNRYMSELEARLITVEKRLGIDHPSHQRGDNVRAVW